VERQGKREEIENRGGTKVGTRVASESSQEAVNARQASAPPPSNPPKRSDRAVVDLEGECGHVEEGLKGRVACAACAAATRLGLEGGLAAAAPPPEGLVHAGVEVPVSGG